MTALLHYVFLAIFTWTLRETVLIYILLARVFGAYEGKWIYLYLALGWGTTGQAPHTPSTPLPPSTMNPCCVRITVEYFKQHISQTLLQLF